MPMPPIRIILGSLEVDDLALVDSGSTICVLPYDLGTQLGLDWNDPLPIVPLGGNLGHHLAKGVALEVKIGSYPPVEIAFAWSQFPQARLLLGRINFFSAFDVCLHRSRSTFEVKPKP